VDLARRDVPPDSLLLLEILDGHRALSVRGDEAEESWRIVEPVLAAWGVDAVPLDDHPAGSGVPARAHST
jgi:glucose-6-phosphate 1-dehydrogenase